MSYVTLVYKNKGAEMQVFFYHITKVYTTIKRRDDDGRKVFVRHAFLDRYEDFLSHLHDFLN